MQCPKCAGTLEVKTYGADISIHRCDRCHGMFCDPATLALMKQDWMSEAVLDTGDPAIGEIMDKWDEIKCPVCNLDMEKTADQNQKHIWFEACPDGHGVFLDAGEFTDLKYDTLMDVVRGFLKGRRPGK